MTTKRARAGDRIRNNSITAANRLEGLLPVTEDWHAKVVFLKVRINSITSYIFLFNVVLIDKIGCMDTN